MFTQTPFTTKFLSRLIFVSIVGLSLFCSSGINKQYNYSGLDLQGHRGARGLKPENTWPAFQTAMEFNMTTLELDTVLTKDGKVLIHHDSETNPIICQKFDGSPIEKVSLYNLTLDELKQLDCGTKKNPTFPEQVSVPGTKLITIDELFVLVADAEKKSPKPKKYLFNIETKFPDDEKSKVSNEKVQAHVSALIQAIEKAKFVDRVTIQSFYMPALTISKKINPKIKTSALFVPTYFQGAMMKLGLGGSYRKDILRITESLKADTISPYFLYVTPEFVQMAHSKNILVIPWTVNDKAEMKRLVGCGVDGIISDYPNRLRELVSEESAK